MSDVFLQEEVEHPTKHTPYIHELFDKSEQILRQHRIENPDLYRKIEEQKIIKKANENKTTTPASVTSQEENKSSVSKLIESIYFRQSKQKELKAKI